MRGTNFIVEEVPLKTIRPFVLSDIALSDAPATVDTQNSAEVEEYLAKQVLSRAFFPLFFLFFLRPCVVHTHAGEATSQSCAEG